MNERFVLIEMFRELFEYVLGLIVQTKVMIAHGRQETGMKKASSEINNIK